MKKAIKLFLVFIFSAFVLQKAGAGLPPTFNMTVKNITTFPGPFDRDSILEFDVYCLQTNFGAPGVDPFEYCAGQFTWYFNKAIFPPGSVLPGNQQSLSFVSSDLPSGLVSPTTQIDTTNGYLKTSGNLPNSHINYFISSIFPGTFMSRWRIRTTAHSFNIVPLNLRFKLGPAPNAVFAYFLPYSDTVDTERIPKPPQFPVILLDTVQNVYTVENGGFVLPVELSNFVSNVERNNVTLNWTTTAETNNQGFDIERTMGNSDEWTKAGYVSGNGTVTVIKNYSFSERVSTGHFRYRLKQIDFNGGYNYYELSSEVVVGIPVAYSISQNYPNPFNPSTKIDFELPYEGKVRILLYDISGREVSKLTNEILTAGYHTIQFNASNLSSGMYFYRIDANGGSQNFVDTKKMMYVK